MTRISPLVEPAAEALAPEEWPKIDHLITEDDTPVDNIFCERQQRLLVESLHSSWAGTFNTGRIDPMENGTLALFVNSRYDDGR